MKLIASWMPLVLNCIKTVERDKGKPWVTCLVIDCTINTDLPQPFCISFSYSRLYLQVSATPDSSMCFCLHWRAGTMSFC